MIVCIDIEQTQSEDHASEPEISEDYDQEDLLDLELMTEDEVEPTVQTADETASEELKIEDLESSVDSYLGMDLKEMELADVNIERLEQQLKFVNKESRLLQKRRFPESQDSLGDSHGLPTER